MARKSRPNGLHRRGEYWPDWDRRKDGGLRSPFLTIFWYDQQRRRVRSVSTGSNNLAPACEALDRHYQKYSRGENFCRACGQSIEPHTGILVLRAVADYLIKKENAPSINAIRARLAHVVTYVATLSSPAVTCEEIDEDWIEKFREWMGSQPIVTQSTKSGKRTERARTASTIENSVLQLAAALNATRKDGKRAAIFKPIKLTELSSTPTKRLSVDELAEAFRYATNPRFPSKRAALHRFLILSVATAARPDAVHDFSLDPAKKQWNKERHVIGLNPHNRRQTKKYRAMIIAPRQIVPLLQEVEGHWIPGVSVRSAWRSMCKELGWPGDGEAGMKLIRRSIAQLLRDAGTVRGWNGEWRKVEYRVVREDIELQLGHRRIKSMTDIYAPFEPDYLAAVTKALEAIIDAIIQRVPGAFTLSPGKPLHGEHR